MHEIAKLFINSWVNKQKMENKIILKLSIMALSTAIRNATLYKIKLSVLLAEHHDTQHSDIQHNVTPHNI